MCVLQTVEDSIRVCDKVDTAMFARVSARKTPGGTPKSGSWRQTRSELMRERFCKGQKLNYSKELQGVVAILQISSNDTKWTKTQ